MKKSTVKQFLDYMNSELDKTQDDDKAWDDLYKEMVEIKFKGRKVVIPFQAIVFNSITEALEDMLNDQVCSVVKGKTYLETTYHGEYESEVL